MYNKSNVYRFWVLLPWLLAPTFGIGVVFVPVACQRAAVQRSGTIEDKDVMVFFDELAVTHSYSFAVRGREVVGRVQPVSGVFFQLVSPLEPSIEYLDYYLKDLAPDLAAEARHWALAPGDDIKIPLELRRGKFTIPWHADNDDKSFGYLFSDRSFDAFVADLRYAVIRDENRADTLPTWVREDARVAILFPCAHADKGARGDLDRVDSDHQPKTVASVTNGAAAPAPRRPVVPVARLSTPRPPSAAQELPGAVMFVDFSRIPFRNGLVVWGNQVVGLKQIFPYEPHWRWYCLTYVPDALRGEIRKWASAPQDEDGVDCYDRQSWPSDGFKHARFSRENAEFGNFFATLATAVMTPENEVRMNALPQWVLERRDVRQLLRFADPENSGPQPAQRHQAKHP